VNVPVELIIWIGGGILAMFSVCAHLLVRISAKQSDIVLEQALQKQAINYLKRTVERLDNQGRRFTDERIESHV
jgi:cytochrome oxidase Cu insertion factor (SCO1/SenC/PrrC family)